VKASTELSIVGWFLNIGAFLYMIDGTINNIVFLSAVVIANVHLVGSRIAKLIENRDSSSVVEQSPDKG
jgi:hypothetical protein